MSEDIKYEYKSVQVVRGMEKRSIAKVAQEGGWELVDQTQGTLRTTLRFRRAKPETFMSKAWDMFRDLAPVKQRAVAATAAILLVLAAAGIGLAATQDKGDNNAVSTAPTSNEAPPVKETPTPTPTSPPSEAPAQVITAANNHDLAELLTIRDECDPAIAQFAAKYRDKQLEFDGSVVNMQLHDNYKTRYDLLLAPGDFSPNSAVGPAFKYANVNMFDLHFTGNNIPDSVSEGARFRFTAKVATYNPKQCLFFLTPVSTAAG